ncbi:hypothetical protein PQE73_gp004 [Bacillus phage vB_BanS_MrDarsey]|nr:hypothetical protein PQE73_gp004 [Bacillus phage vB_BanS_MrDarsey]UGO47836.1 hypothetical protein MRDARSEY_4 [Bacillus phage vB_BanS_MrDarsey]
MTKKLLGEKACRNRLQKEVDRMFTPVEQEIIGWYEDQQTETTYTWKGEHNGKDFRLVCCKKRGTVTICS